MIQRSTMQDLVKAIKLQPNEIKKLPVKDREFFEDIEEQCTHYGYGFSEKQLKWLSSIYREVYKNV